MPRLEEWILKAAREAGVDMRNYGLPDDADQSHKVINIRSRQFVNLLEDIKGKSRMLKTLEDHLKGKSYK